MLTITQSLFVKYKILKVLNKFEINFFRQANINARII